MVAQVKSPFTELPTIYIYEKYPGGVGYAEQLFGSFRQILEQAYQLLINCQCDEGCPSCVGPQVEMAMLLKLLPPVLEEALKHKLTDKLRRFAAEPKSAQTQEQTADLAFLQGQVVTNPLAVITLLSVLLL